LLYLRWHDVWLRLTGRVSGWLWDSAPMAVFYRHAGPEANHVQKTKARTELCLGTEMVKRKEKKKEEKKALHAN